MAEKSRVSVVIPTYNSKHYVCEAIDSCLAQTHTPLEIIVVDDGSTDGTGQLLQGRYGNQIVYVYQDNAGPGNARNRGIEIAQGDFIKFLDSDDLLYSTHIERSAHMLAESPAEVAIVYTRFRSVEADGTTPRPDSFEPPLLSGDVYCEVLQSNGTAILTSAVMVRREALVAVGSFPDDPAWRHGEDWDTFLRLAARYQYLAIPDILLDYRVHQANLVRDNAASAAGRLRVIQQAARYSRTRECLDESAYQRLLAGRYHVLAMEEWKRRNRRAARAAFQQAIHLAPERAMLRRLYVLLTYVAPASVAHRVNRWLQRGAPA